MKENIYKIFILEIFDLQYIMGLAVIYRKLNGSLVIITDLYGYKYSIYFPIVLFTFTKYIYKKLN